MTEPVSAAVQPLCQAAADSNIVRIANLAMNNFATGTNSAATIKENKQTTPDCYRLADQKALQIKAFRSRYKRATMNGSSPAKSASQPVTKSTEELREEYMGIKRRKRPEGWPAWFFAGTINEAIFCQEFLADHKLVYTENAFFTPQGKMIDESPLQAEIYEIIEPFASTSVTKKISNIVGLLKISAHVDNLPPETDRIHVANGTLMLDGSFSASMDQIVRCRFPIRYNPDAGEPTKWLHFLNQLLHPEDIPTLQEYVGYCLIPSTAAKEKVRSARC